jgi:phosphatidyl-myo-inositol dimannoside synthase
MILILTQCFPPDLGGIQSLMAGLARAASDRGRQVRVLADTSSGWQGYDEAASGLDIVRYGGPKPLRRRLKAWAARRVIESDTPEVVFCDSWRSLEYLAPTNVPLVVLAHGTEFPQHPTRRRSARMVEALARASVVVAASKFAATLAKPYISGATRLTVVNPPIAPLPVATEGAQAMRAQYGDPILVGLARLETRKGFDRVIEALPIIAERHPRVAFLVGGEGADKARLQELAKARGVASRVQFLGSVVGERKAALLSAADLFVMPTRRVGNSVEGFGIVYAEAAWYGVPSIAGMEGGAGDFVDDEVTGRLVDGNQPIVGTLLDMLADRTALRSMGRAAQAKVRGSGMWSQAFDRYLEAARVHAGARR